MFKNVVIIAKRLSWYISIVFAVVVGLLVGTVLAFGPVFGYLFYILPTAAKISTAFPGGMVVEKLLVSVSFLLVIVSPIMRLMMTPLCSPIDTELIATLDFLWKVAVFFSSCLLSLILVCV